MRKLIIPHEALDRHEKTLGKALLECLERIAGGQSVSWVDGGKHDYRAKTNSEKSYWMWVCDEFNNKHILSADPIALFTFAKNCAVRFAAINTHSKKRLTARQKAVVAVAKALFDYAKFRAGKILLPYGLQRRIQWMDPPVKSPKRKTKNYEVCKKAWEEWRGWSLAEYVRLLNVRYCPYCNAETVGIVYPANEKQKESFSAIDHILPKSDYPLLALSLYNLVPACYRCNSQFKGKKDRFDLEHWQKNEPFKAFHPYTHNVHKWFRFDYRPSTVAHLFLKPEDDDSPLSITRKIPLEQSARKGDLQFYFGRTEHHLDDFRLLNSYRDLYSSEINGILKMEMICTPTFIETMKSSYPGMTDEDFNLVFRRTSLDPREINRHRFAKLIIDLHKQIGKEGLFDGETVLKTPEEVLDAINENLAEQQARWEERKQKIEAAFRKSYWFMSNNKVTDNG